MFAIVIMMGYLDRTLRARRYYLSVRNGPDTETCACANLRGHGILLNCSGEVDKIVETKAGVDQL
jgi:hypothetical protein